MNEQEKLTLVLSLIDENPLTNLKENHTVMADLTIDQIKTKAEVEADSFENFEIVIITFSNIVKKKAW